MNTACDKLDSGTKALNLLQSLGKNQESRENRILELLRPPDGEQHHGWHFYCPSCFNDALDIRQTPRMIEGERVIQWTQGSSFAFSKGDVIYDTPNGYLDRPDALKTFKMCINIISATDVSPAQPHKLRHPGFVQYAILKPTSAGTKLEIIETKEATQDEFVEFLISGKNR